MMATQHPDAAAERELSELVACTLNETNLKTQRERWINLGENFGIGRSETADGLRLTFKDHPAVASELEALVEVENHCCSWAAWTVERGEDGELVLAARSRGQGIATLHGLFTSEALRSDPLLHGRVRKSRFSVPRWDAHSRRFAPAKRR
jgi:hypothetical protein